MSGLLILVSFLPKLEGRFHTTRSKGPRSKLWRGQCQPTRIVSAAVRRVSGQSLRCSSPSRLYAEKCIWRSRRNSAGSVISSMVAFILPAPLIPPLELFLLHPAKCILSFALCVQMLNYLGPNSQEGPPNKTKGLILSNQLFFFYLALPKSSMQPSTPARPISMRRTSTRMTCATCSSGC